MDKTVEPSHPEWHGILHDHVAWRLRRTLQAVPGVIVTSVPFHLADRSRAGGQ